MMRRSKANSISESPKKAHELEVPGASQVKVRRIGPKPGELVESFYEEKENYQVPFCILISLMISHILAGKGMEFIWRK
jgi:hypothetical protein